MLLKLVAFVITIWLALGIFVLAEPINRSYFKWFKKQSKLTKDAITWTLRFIYIAPTFGVFYYSFWYGLVFVSDRAPLLAEVGEAVSFGMVVGMIIGALLCLAAILLVYVLKDRSRDASAHRRNMARRLRMDEIDRLS